MKKIYIIIILLTLISIPKNNPIIGQSLTEVNDYKFIDKMDIIAQALIYHESRGDSTIINKRSGASGILQLMPIYVKHCNYLLGENKFKPKDRLSSKKSIKMFKVVQEHHNKEKSPEKAIKLHNPKGSVRYKSKVMKTYTTLLNNYKSEGYRIIN